LLPPDGYNTLSVQQDPTFVETSLVTEWLGKLFSIVRDWIARGLLRIRVTPNRLTVIGFLFTVAAGVMFALGRMYWAAGLMFLAGACDVLDGAVARLGKLRTDFGAFLDSTLDRLSDCALYGGLAVWYASDKNITYVLLCVVATAGAISVSYARARAENIGVDAHAGLFERGERFIVLMAAACFGNVELALWLLAIHPFGTVLHRILIARKGAGGGDPYIRAPLRPLGDLVIWNHKRGSWPYDLIVTAYIGVLPLVPISDHDVLGSLLKSISG